MNGIEYYKQFVSEKAENIYYDGCDYMEFMKRIYDYSSVVAKVLRDMSYITAEQYIYDTTRIAGEIVVNTIKHTQ